MKIKLLFTDFWPTFNYKDNYFTKLLSKRFDIEIDPVNPDFLISSVFNLNHLNYHCVKIQFIGENLRPDYSLFDYSFSFDHDDHNQRNFRLPLYVMYDDVRKLQLQRNPEAILAKKTGFCSFIYSNAACKKRNEFFKKLSKYKKVDSGGRLFNNIGGRVKDKFEFIGKYKFNIAFENEEFPGYTTEKIFEPFLVNSLPVYWGNPLVHKDFSPKSFLNYYDYNSDEELIDAIIKIDNDDNLYSSYLMSPPFENNILTPYVDEEVILNHFEFIFKSKIEPVSGLSPVFNGNSLQKRIYFFQQKLKLRKYILKMKLRGLSVEKVKIKLKKMSDNNLQNHFLRLK